MPAPAPAQRLLPIAALFVLTGACGLAYEVIWARHLAIFLGHDALAHAVVLGAFMGGQAGGYVWGGRIAPRAPHPVATYGLIEVAIGGYALAFPLLFQAARAAFEATAVGLALEAGTTAIVALKLVAAAALVVPPAVAMGATLPLLAEGAVGAGAALERALGRLYAANCGGAVLGALVAGYGLVPGLGLTRGLVAVGLANAAAGAVAFVVGRALPRSATQQKPGKQDAAVTPEPAEGGGEGRSRVRWAVAIAAAGATGAAAFAYEVAWTRLLAIVLGGSTYAFTIMLAAFILGIAIGAALSGSRRVAGARDPLRLFGWVEVALGAAVAATLPLADLLPLVFDALRDALPPTDGGFVAFQVAELALCLIVLAVPTVLGGLALPLATRAAAAALPAGAAPARAVAATFAANTAGCLVGALGTGLVLLPELGLRHTFTVAIGLNALAGGAAVALASGPPLARALGVLGAASVIALAATATALERGALTFQVFRSGGRSDRAEAEEVGGVAGFRARAGKRGERIVYDKDGASGTVTVLRSARTGALTMLINGKADASTGEDIRTQLLLAHIPLLLRPHAKDVLVVGLGSGMTAGSVLTHPVASLDVVELSPEVVEASRLFDGATGAPLADTRTALIVDDARTALRLSRRSYDVIVSEPSNPWVAGIGSLFTAEHFAAVAARLRPGGLALQWIHAYEISDELVQVVLRTYLRVFPHVRIFCERGQRDVFLLGSTAPLEVDLDALAARFSTVRVRADLARDRLETPEALLALELFGPAQAPLVARGRAGALVDAINTDDRPVLEFEAPRPFFKGTNARGLAGLAFHPDRPAEPPGDRLLERWVAARPPTAAVRAAVRAYLGQAPRMPWPELAPDDASPEMARRSRLSASRGAK